MAKTFTAQLSAHTTKYQRRLSAVVKASAQDVFSQAQRAQGSIAERPKEARAGRQATYELGKIPVDTGFLRNSFISGLNGGKVAGGANSYVLAIAQSKPGDVIFGGWTAKYARVVEYGNASRPPAAFMRTAAANWRKIVRKNEAIAKLRIR